MDSFISWIGGKKLLRKHICNQFPENINKYVEVFGGAGWVLFYKDKHADVEVYNDINSELVNLFRCVKYHPEAIEKEMEYTLNSREIFNCFKNQGIETLTDIQRAARYLYLIKASYGSKTKVYGLKPRKIANFNKITDIRDRLSKVIIENRSFNEVIRAYDSSGTLFYCDPPYFNAEQFYDTGNFVFDEEQHVLLKRILSNIKGKFILSYNDNPYIKELYKDFEIEEVSRQNNLMAKYGKNKVYRELIIKNFK